MRVHIHVHGVHTYLHMYTQHMPHTYTHIYTQLHTRSYTRMHTHTYAHTHTHADTYTHTIQDYIEESKVIYITVREYTYTSVAPDVKGNSPTHLYTQIRVNIRYAMNNFLKLLANLIGDSDN